MNTTGKEEHGVLDVVHHLVEHGANILLCARRLMKAYVLFNVRYVKLEPPYIQRQCYGGARRAQHVWHITFDRYIQC